MEGFNTSVGILDGVYRLVGQTPASASQPPGWLPDLLVEGFMEGIIEGAVSLFELF